MKHTFLFAFFISAWSMYAQPEVKVEVSADTISIGEIVEVTYTIENGDGNFIMPDMHNLPVVSGPNSSSSFMYQDGKMRSNQSYSFALVGLEEGKITIPKATYKSGKEEMTINPVEIVVVSEKEKQPASKNKPEPAKTTPVREKRKF